MATHTNAVHDSPSGAGAAAGAGDVQARVDQATRQAQEKAQEKAQQAAGQAQLRMREQLDQRSTQLGEQVHQQASDLRSVSEALRDQGKHRPAQAVERLAGYAEQAGGYLRDKNADTMLSDAEDFGRQRPGVVAAGALALGFVASRFLKASSSRRYSARDAGRGRVALPESSWTGSEVAPAGSRWTGSEVAPAGSSWAGSEVAPAVPPPVGPDDQLPPRSGI